MPTYVYQCPDDECAHTEEIRHPVPGDQWPVHRCSACGLVMVRVVQPVGLQFKGEGWTEKGNV